MIRLAVCRCRHRRPFFAPPKRSPSFSQLCIFVRDFVVRSRTRGSSVCPPEETSTFGRSHRPARNEPCTVDGKKRGKRSTEGGMGCDGEVARSEGERRTCWLLLPVLLGSLPLLPLAHQYLLACSALASKSHICASSLHALNSLPHSLRPCVHPIARPSALNPPSALALAFARSLAPGRRPRADAPRSSAIAIAQLQGERRGRTPREGGREENAGLRGCDRPSAVGARERHGGRKGRRLEGCRIISRRPSSFLSFPFLPHPALREH